LAPPAGPPASLRVGAPCGPPRTGCTPVLDGAPGAGRPSHGVGQRPRQRQQCPGYAVAVHTGDWAPGLASSPPLHVELRRAAARLPWLGGRCRFAWDVCRLMRCDGAPRGWPTIPMAWASARGIASTCRWPLRRGSCTRFGEAPRLLHPHKNGPRQPAVTVFGPTNDVRIPGWRGSAHLVCCSSVLLRRRPV
jgi:hypothetical protein